MATKIKQDSITIRQNKSRDLSPKWEGSAEWSGDQFTAHFRNSMNWYRLEKSVKDLKPSLINWMGQKEYDRAEIDTVRKIKDKYFNSTMVNIAACLVKGMPEVHAGFNEGRDTGAWLRKEIDAVIAAGYSDIEDEDAPKTEKPVTYAPTIQDRLREAAGDMSEELDMAIDSWIADPEAFNPKEFKVVNLLKGKGVKAVHARLVKQYFQSGQAELLELSSGSADEQLREAYSHNSRKNVKKLIEFYESIISACEQIAAEAKIAKPSRAKKIKPAEQLVAKLKFCIKDDKLGIVSVPPAGIIGAQGAVVYNVKTRKLGMYIAKTSEGLGVKGTSITNFTDKSFQRTLRKPDVQLKEFKDQNTPKRVETWFNKIKTTETVLNGRMNDDVVLLKIFK
jgi:hypothetical protein